VQLGAGGTGKAVAHAALSCGVKKLTSIDVDTDRAAATAEPLAARFGDRCKTFIR
jgi:shikimate dehydrogenase